MLPLRAKAFTYFLSVCSLGVMVATAAVLNAETLSIVRSAPLMGSLEGKPVSKWRGGSLVLVEQAMGSSIPFSIYGKDGQREVLKDVSFPGGRQIVVRNWTRNQEGRIAFCGTGTNTSGESHSFIAWFHPSEPDITVVKTNPHLAFSIAFAPDGTIWTAGSVNSLKPPATQDETDMFHHYDAKGNLLNSFMQPSSPEEAFSMISTSNLFEVTEKGAVWFSPQEKRYISVSNDGKIIRKSTSDYPFTPMFHTSGAISNKGEVYVSLTDESQWAIYRLDTQSMNWAPVHHANRSKISKPLTVLGLEEDAIVSWRVQDNHLLFLN